MKHSAKKKRFVRLSSILSFLLAVVVDLVAVLAVVTRVLSIFGDSSIGERRSEKGSSETSPIVSAGTTTLVSRNSDRE